MRWRHLCNLQSNLRGASRIRARTVGPLLFLVYTIGLDDVIARHDLKNYTLMTHKYMAAVSTMNLMR